MIPDKIYDISDKGLLISVINNNDHGAFEEIFNRYWSQLYSYALKFLGDKDICEDIVQEIFVNFWFRKKELNISNLSSYLYTAVKYKIINHFRKGDIDNKFFKEWVELLNPESIEDTLEIRDLNNLVEKFIDKLPEQRRLIFNLNRKENLSHKEIAEKLNISVQTVKNQVSKALKFIRRAVKFFVMFL